MYENEVKKAQERLNAALTLAKQQPDEAVNMILDMQKWVEETLPNDCPEFYGVVITYSEVIGDMRLRAKNFVEAETYYKKMVQYAQKLYELDKEKFDLRLAQTYAKLANNCRTSIGCNVFGNKPRALTEKTQRAYDAGVNFYKAAITVIKDNAKKGSAKHLSLRADCIAALAIMNASTGNYKDAIAMYKDVVNIQKAIYQAVDNKEMGLKLATSMATLATIYSLYKDAENAQNSLEDSIFVLSEHEKEDPVRFGILIARNYMNLAGCHVILKHDEKEIDAAYEKATQKIGMVNAMAKNAALADEITCYMLSGQYYQTRGDRKKGDAQLNHAYETAKTACEMAPDNKQFEAMKKRLEMLLKIKSEEEA